MRRSTHFRSAFGALLITIGAVVVIGATGIYLTNSGGGLKAITKGCTTMFLTSMFWISSSIVCLRDPAKLNNLERVRDKLVVGIYGTAVVFLIIGYVMTLAHARQSSPLIWFSLMLLMAGSIIFMGVFEIRKGLSTDNV